MFPLVALVGFAVVLLMRRDGTKADDCETLFKGDPAKIAACKVGRTVLGALGDAAHDLVTNYEDVYPHNAALNGPAVEWWDEPDNDDTFYAASPLGNGDFAYSDRTYAATGPNGASHPKRHENGCVPLEGHPDWKNCAPGTKSMARGLRDPGHRATADGPAAPRRFGGDFSSKDAVGSGDPLRDGMTFPWDQRPSSMRRVATEPHRPLAFPLDVPPGSTAWVVRGEAVVCPPGTEVRGRDHRTGAETRSPCSVANQTPAPPVVQPVRDASGCINYYTADGASHRDCRSDATMPPGATTTPPLGRTGTVRMAGFGTGGGSATNGSYR